MSYRKSFQINCPPIGIFLPQKSRTHRDIQRLVTAAGVSLSFLDMAVCMVSVWTRVSLRVHCPVFSLSSLALLLASSRQWATSGLEGGP